MAEVVFTELGEFVGEAKRDAEAIDRQVCRVTKRMERRGSAPGVSAVTVEAGFTVKGEVVRFCRYVGDLWGLDTDEEVERRGNEVQERLGEELEELGLEGARWVVQVRGG